MGICGKLVCHDLIFQLRRLALYHYLRSRINARYYINCYNAFVGYHLCQGIVCKFTGGGYTVLSEYIIEPFLCHIRAACTHRKCIEKLICHIQPEVKICIDIVFLHECR